MTEALKELIQQEAKYYVKNRLELFEEISQREYKLAAHTAHLAGATSMVDKMEGFAEWCSMCGWTYNSVTEKWDNDYVRENPATSELLSIYFEQLKKKEIVTLARCVKS